MTPHELRVLQRKGRRYDILVRWLQGTAIGITVLLVSGFVD